MSALIKTVFDTALKNSLTNFCRNLYTSNILEREHRKNKRQNIVIKEDTVPQEKSFDVGPAWIKYTIIFNFYIFVFLY